MALVWYNMVQIYGKYCQWGRVRPKASPYPIGEVVKAASGSSIDLSVHHKYGDQKFGCQAWWLRKFAIVFYGECLIQQWKSKGYWRWWLSVYIMMMCLYNIIIVYYIEEFRSPLSGCHQSSFQLCQITETGSKLRCKIWTIQISKHSQLNEACCSRFLPSKAGFIGTNKNELTYK